MFITDLFLDQLIKDKLKKIGNVLYLNLCMQLQMKTTVELEPTK